MERQLLIALVAMMAVLAISQYFFRPATGSKPAAKPNQPATAQQAAQQAGKPEPPPTVNPAAPVAPAANEVRATSEQTVDIDTSVYRIRFTNKGGLVKSWQLKKFKDSKGNPLELVNPLVVGHAYYPFSVEFKGANPGMNPNDVLFVANKSSDGLGVDFEYVSGGVQAKKSFRFKDNSYLSEVQSVISRDGRPIPHLLAWRGGFGDEEVQTAATTQHTLYYDQGSNKLTVNDVKAAKDGAVLNSGNYSFAGLEDTYFAAAFLPKEKATLQIETSNTAIPSRTDKKEEPRVGAAVGSESGNEFSLFVGPKDNDLLRQVNPRLEKLIDWGWFGLLAKPLFIALQYLNDKITHNYGWAIVLITVIINMALLPLRMSGMKSGRKMQALQPQINVIREKYKGLSMRDPKKQEESQEIMAIYQKNGVNPAGGCLPLLLQLPFFIAFFKVLSVAIELRGAQWLWVTDLSQPETIALRILPILMIVTQILQQKMTPSAAMDPQQQRMMYLMPIFFGYIFYGFASGLVLYYLTANLVGIIQQWFFNKTMPMPAVTVEPAPKKKNGRR